MPYFFGTKSTYDKGVITISTLMDISEKLLQGIGVTFTILLASALFSYLMAFIAGLCRLSDNVIIRKGTGFYVEVFRGTSLIVQLFWFYYALPMLFGFNSLDNWWIGVIAIGLNYGAYLSEVVRSSILAVSKGQSEAATALNMSRFQRMRLVIFPQAVRMMLPEFGNYTIQILKGTSLVSLIGLQDILYHGESLRNVSSMEMGGLIYFVALIFYFVLALPLIFFTRKAEKIAKKGVAN
ncbi:amino acid ABC transporter permease [Oceanobacillus iheyensis HTE831]|uniref:Amino acid ABC transporter permease n=2 Tax=Oceanobacillus iheyensis TaxID=182710 RepID=Q8ESR1_OCEIH|nr:amino acid ABC transporter permease [Oceanobacillus iheyensis HTE831]